MNETLRQRVFPNVSIKLRPPSPSVPHQHLCKCQMCSLQKHILNEQEVFYNNKMKKKISQGQISSGLNCDASSYEWVLNRMIMPQHKIIHRGIDIFIPETLFFKDGEPVSIYMNRETNVHHIQEFQDYRIKKIKKEKISNTYVQKVFNQSRRKYRDQVQIKTGQKKVIKKKSMFAKKQPRIDTKDATVIQYIDGTQQLITENQLINLMLKRKQDSIWKSIVMIKNFITSEDVNKCQFKIQFSYADHLYPDLFERTQRLMKTYGGYIQPLERHFISDQQENLFCASLIQKDIKVFAEYSVYKIVSFVEYFYDERILEIDCSILINEFSRPYLLDVFKLSKKELLKYSWTNEIYNKRISQEENRVFKNDKTLQSNPEIQQKSKKIQEYMMSQYESEKFKHGLSVVPDDNTEQKANDKFFSFLHPDLKLELSTILKTQNTSILQFKKKHLGYTPEKKPVMRPFNSTFVKTLHILTPKLKLSSKIFAKKQLSTQKSKQFRSRKQSASLNRSRKQDDSTLVSIY